MQSWLSRMSSRTSVWQRDAVALSYLWKGDEACVSQHALTVATRRAQHRLLPADGAARRFHIARRSRVSSPSCPGNRRGTVREIKMQLIAEWTHKHTNPSLYEAVPSE